MKVLMINGSRRANGCTFTALTLAAQELYKEGIESEILNVGCRVVKGELNAVVREALEIMKEADGLVIGSPVYYASPSGEVLSFLDRLFWEGGDVLRCKPCATLTSARRAGTTASLDALNKYPTICEMPLVSSCYWNMVHGFTPEDVMEDLEGVQIMRTLGRNMAWLLKSIEAGKQAGLAQPAPAERVHTNFIR
ncbi:MAG: flavodoxin family protein [Oscillospiraceae bacterium]|nr:flavodoxin family protein [Oscillospiraceae bacterium]